MTSNPLEAEATGQEFIEATFRGSTFRLPLDVDSWPLGLITRCRGLRDGVLTVDHAMVQQVLRILLRDQWDAFRAVATKRRHWVPAAQEFATAVGFPPRGRSDVVFGSIPWLLTLIEEWPDKVESDLDRFWDIDYGDRYLFQQGRRRLTLRKIHVRMTNLPIDSAVAIAMNDGKLHKTGSELVLMDLFEMWSGKRHPSRPMSPEQLAERAATVAAEEKAKSAYRAKHDKTKPKNAIETARANALRGQGNHGIQAEE